MKEEVWHTDPYRLHEARCFSDGTPTLLVRDARGTSKDSPPNIPYLDQPEPVPQKASSAADDIRRAEDGKLDNDRVQDATWTSFGGGCAARRDPDKLHSSTLHGHGLAALQRLPDKVAKRPTCFIRKVRDPFDVIHSRGPEIEGEHT